MLMLLSCPSRPLACSARYMLCLGTRPLALSTKRGKLYSIYLTLEVVGNVRSLANVHLADTKTCPVSWRLDGRQAYDIGAYGRGWRIWMYDMGVNVQFVVRNISDQFG